MNIARGTVLVAIAIAGCTTNQQPTTADSAPSDYELVKSHDPRNGTKLDYVYWESYLLQHGEAETVRRFEELLAAAEPEDAAALNASFERFCRFQGCLQTPPSRRPERDP